ncbi:hypothetical protein ACYOEI_00315 [Singulisphaera rosea]
MTTDSIISEVRKRLHADRDRLKVHHIAWDGADVMEVIKPFLHEPTVDVYALRRSLSVMTGLCRIKYGDLDQDIYAEIEKAEKLLAATHSKEDI